MILLVDSRSYFLLMPSWNMELTKKQDESFWSRNLSSTLNFLKPEENLQHICKLMISSFLQKNENGLWVNSVHARTYVHGSSFLWNCQKVFEFDKILSRTYHRQCRILVTIFLLLSKKLLDLFVKLKKITFHQDLNWYNIQQIHANISVTFYFKCNYIWCCFEESQDKRRKKSPLVSFKALLRA